MLITFLLNLLFCCIFSVVFGFIIGIVSLLGGALVDELINAILGLSAIFGEEASKLNPTVTLIIIAILMIIAFLITIFILKMENITDFRIPSGKYWTNRIKPKKIKNVKIALAPIFIIGIAIVAISVVLFISNIKNVYLAVKIFEEEGIATGPFGGRGFEIANAIRIPGFMLPIGAMFVVYIRSISNSYQNDVCWVCGAIGSIKTEAVEMKKLDEYDKNYYSTSTEKVGEVTTKRGDTLTEFYAPVTRVKTERIFKYLSRYRSVCVFCGHENEYEQEQEKLCEFLKRKSD